MLTLPLLSCLVMLVAIISFCFIICIIPLNNVTFVGGHYILSNWQARRSLGICTMKVLL